jgi:hypothetical protein
MANESLRNPALDHVGKKAFNGFGPDNGPRRPDACSFTIIDIQISYFYSRWSIAP